MIENRSKPADLRKIEVVGTHMKLVEAEQAVLRFAITGRHDDPKTAIIWASRKSAAIESVLSSMEVTDVKSSGARMTKNTRKVKDKLAAFTDDYVTTIQYWAATTDIDIIMEIQLKLVELGVTELYPTAFSLLSPKRHYGEVRRKAMKAAKDKAEIYCKEAGLRLGAPIIIRDISPEVVEGRRISHDGDFFPASWKSPAESEPTLTSPDLIPVNGALKVTFEILVD